MPRHKKCRRICAMPEFGEFSPRDRPCAQTIIMELDEYETIRLIDLQNFTQEQCARQMQIARTTATSIYNSARTKMADALINGKRLIIDGGDIEICSRSMECMNSGCRCCHNHCEKCDNNGGKQDEISSNL